MPSLVAKLGWSSSSFSLDYIRLNSAGWATKVDPRGYEGPRDGGLLALYPTVTEVVETAVTEEVDEGAAPIAPTDVWLPPKTTASRFAPQLPV